MYGFDTSPTPPQPPFYDNQDTFNPDIDELYTGFITPIDQARSHFNALIPGSQVVTPGYQESRCHAFFRMMGFPVASNKSNGYYSPGYDPSLNLDTSAQNTNTQIANKVSADADFVFSQYQRETQIQSIYLPVFNNGGINATAISIGSMHIRSYATQFTDGLGPLYSDRGQMQQVIPERKSDIDSFFSSFTKTFPSQYDNITQSLLTSTHVIKPFVVDPRIDNTIQPNANRIAAPFLRDRSWLKIFDGQSQAPIILKRPYIEFVLSAIFNNTNAQQLADAKYVSDVVASITASDPSNPALLDAIRKTNLTQTGISVFGRYLKMIRSLVTLLVQSQTQLEVVRTNMNFQPIPNNTYGVEAGAMGATIPQPTPGDPNNQLAEASLINTQTKQIMQEFQLGVGLDGVPSPGDFAFSGADDIVFDAKKVAKTSYDDIIQEMITRRTQVGNDGMNALKTIEIIVGEFSGLGLLDIFAIQAAMWVVDPSVLVSMIDKRAIDRMQQRQDLAFNGVSQGSDIVETLTQFETVVVSMYKLIDAYIQDLTTNGQYKDIPPDK